MLTNNEEKPFPKYPLVLIPKDDVKCPLTFANCGETSRREKQICNYNGCPYDITGDDGMC